MNSERSSLQFVTVALFALALFHLTALSEQDKPFEQLPVVRSKLAALTALHLNTSSRSHVQFRICEKCNMWIVPR